MYNIVIFYHWGVNCNFPFLGFAHETWLYSGETWRIELIASVTGLMQQMQQAQQQDGPKLKVVQFIVFTARSWSADVVM